MRVQIGAKTVFNFVRNMQLAVIKGAIINSDDFWLAVIEYYDAGNRAADEFYGSE